MNGPSLAPHSIGNGTGVNTNARAESQPERSRRGVVACRRCRRLRSKCIHRNATPPCERCKKISPEVASSCSFPARGEKDEDRTYRRRTIPNASNELDLNGHQGGGRSLSLTVSHQSPGIGSQNAEETSSDISSDLFPPHEEVIEACERLWNSYFQLGFLSKTVFFERLSNDFIIMNKFLILAILSISARFTPSLVRRYNGGPQATEVFVTRASQMVPSVMYKATIENIQGLFLLSIAEWGNGEKDKSSIHVGIAIRMAGMLGLHQEETYFLGENPSPEETVEAESARRTFWMIQSQEDLHSGLNSPASFVLTDITALLPCEENDFAFGTNPPERAALAGTRAAMLNPRLTDLPSRSLFASLVQAHRLWGQVARRARSDTGFLLASDPPWKSNSDYTQLAQDLTNWELTLPPRHRWSVWNLRGYKAEGVHLAYLSTTMVYRLSEIVLRRAYLEEIITCLTSDTSSQHPNADFLKNMSEDLFTHVFCLFEQVESFNHIRSPDEGFPAIIVFCIYVCGTLASYLWRWQPLYPQKAAVAHETLNACLKVLNDLRHAWPMSSAWHHALSKLGGLQHSSHGLDETQLAMSQSTSHAHEVSNSGHQQGQDHAAVHSEITPIELVAEHQPVLQDPTSQAFPDSNGLQFPLASFFRNPLNNQLPGDFSMELDALFDETSAFALSFQ